MKLILTAVPIVVPKNLKCPHLARGLYDACPLGSDASSKLVTWGQASHNP